MEKVPVERVLERDEEGEIIEWRYYDEKGCLEDVQILYRVILLNEHGERDDSLWDKERERYAEMGMEDLYDDWRQEVASKKVNAWIAINCTSPDLERAGRELLGLD